VQFEKESEGYLIKVKMDRIKPPRIGVHHTQHEPSLKLKTSKKQKHQKRDIYDALDAESDYE
jgi:hypothetical protein